MSVREELLAKLRDPNFEWDFSQRTHCVIGACMSIGITGYCDLIANRLMVPVLEFFDLAHIPAYHGREFTWEVTRQDAIVALERLFAKYPVSQ